MIVAMLESIRRSFSGTYSIRTAELARGKRINHINVSVLFLDETAHTFQVDKRGKGAELLEQVFQHLELTERDYFGLEFVHKQDDVVRWLDPLKLFRKQWSNIRQGNVPPILRFRVKFFVSDPSLLQEEYTRYHFYLQIKRDVFTGRLPCTINTACLLASYTVQSELGDYNPTEHAPGYLNSLQLLPDQTDELEHRISELHKLHRGQLPADAEYNFLEHAKRLEMYGIDIHQAIDSAGVHIELGVCSTGLLVLQNSIRKNTFSWSKMVKVSFKRKDFFIQLRREPSEDYDTLLGFGMRSHRHAKLLWKSCVEHHSFFRLQRPHRATRFLPMLLGSRFHYVGRTELQAVEESRSRARVAKVFTRSPSKRILSTLPPTGSSDSTTSNGKPQSSILSITKTCRPHDNKVTSKQSETIPRIAWESKCDDGNEFIEQLTRTNESSLPILETCLYDGDNKPDLKIDDDNLITIRLMADEQGRYGFNVKGGVDLKHPVLVSRVVPNSSADRAHPRVCEGDQVVMINEQPIENLTHEEVVTLIRSTRETRSGELVLIMKPNATIIQYPIEDEPLCQYVPENGVDYPPLNGDALFNQSLLLLSDGLASGALVTQYENLYRKNPDLDITEARKPENVTKNRYRDISPYDCTRVQLVNAENGDYINANYVNMDIPGGGVNRYIATQGPLANTTLDFWRMVQQESSYLVVMLTTVLERGRTKCHEYWPQVGGVLKMTDEFSVTSVSEQADETGSFVFREFHLSDTKTGENRTIQHMQYLAWPDHGVPSNPNLFLQFTERVRSSRSSSLLQEIDNSLRNLKILDAVDASDVENGIVVGGERRGVHSSDESPEEIDLRHSTSVHQYISVANPPVIVHCSAGIGRTGVLILMDTALELMKAREPVYPLDIVQTMRDQRACMIQNAAQYRFVCECICEAYKDMVKEEQKDKED